MKETFWFEFDMAELYGEENIRELAAAAFDKWKVEPVILTDLVMVIHLLIRYQESRWMYIMIRLLLINHKSWDHHDRGNDELSSLYADLYYEYYEDAIDYLDTQKDEEGLRYFIRTLD